MSSPSSAFQVGDTVVYPTQGAGKIIARVEKAVAGQTNEYFEIELMKGSMRVHVPVGSPERVGLRRITDAKLIPELLKGLGEPDLELPAGWTPRHRREQLLLAEGNIFTIAQLVGTLHRRDVEKTLSATERKLMDDARHMVSTEVAMSLDIPLSDAEARISSALE
jgi:CarD family transcriptional regulator